MSVSANQFLKWCFVFGIPINGGNTPTEPSYASAVGNLNTLVTSTPVINADYPIYNPITPINSLNFDLQNVTVISRSTPAFTYTGADAETVAIDWNLSVVGSVASDQSYIFQLVILKADGVTTQATGCVGYARMSDLITPYTVSLSTVVQLNPGDSVFVVVRNTLGTGGVYVRFWNAKASNIAALVSGVGAPSVQFVNGIGPDGLGNVELTTDNMPEGAINKYFTESKARAALSAGAGVVYDNSTGIISTPIPPQREVFIDPAGIDDLNPNRGKFYNMPYASIGYATAQQSIGSLGELLVFKCGPGNYTEVNYALKPNIVIDLSGSSFTVNNPITLDSSWSGQSAVTGIINGSECDFACNLDFAGKSVANAKVVLKDILVNGPDNWIIQGLTTGVVEVHIDQVQGVDTGFQAVINDADVYWGDNQIGNVQYDVSQGTRLLQMASIRAYGNMIITAHLASILNVKLDSVQIENDFDILQLSTSTINLITTNFRVLGNLQVSCVDNTKFTWKLDGFYKVPVYASQIPTLAYLTIADGISANYPSPTNYNPVSINIRGHLEGINAKFGTIPANVVNGSWTPTFTAIAGISGTPTLYSANYIRVGSIVFYSAQLSYVATTASNVLNMSLPVASNFTAAGQANGAGSFYDVSSANGHDGEVLSVTADTTNKVLQISLISTVGSGTKNITVCGSYVIV